MEEVLDKTKEYGETMNLSRVLGVRVLSERGLKIGRVSEVRIHPQDKTLEGVVVRRGLFREKLYLGKNYFDVLSSEAIILGIEPNVLLKGKKVVTYDGEVVGKIKDILRVGKTNSLKGLVVHSFWRGTYNVPSSEIRGFGKTIILKDSCDVPKKSFWRRAS